MIKRAGGVMDGPIGVGERCSPFGIVRWKFCDRVATELTSHTLWTTRGARGVEHVIAKCLVVSRPRWHRVSQGFVRNVVVKRAIDRHQLNAAV